MTGRQLDVIRIGERGTVRHYAHEGPMLFTTLCGLSRAPSKVTVVTSDRKARESLPACATCNRVRRLHDVDLVVPIPNTNATRRSEGMTFTEVPARVFRVQGRADTYTVTIPVDPYLATLCTCMAGKTKPDLQCKHQAAVLNALVNSGELIG